MAVSKIEKSAPIYYSDITISTGTSQYDQHYYGDYRNAVPDGYTPLSLTVLTANFNAYIVTQFMGKDVRLWSSRSSATATVRVAYIKST